MAQAAVKSSPKTIGGLADLMFDVREQKRIIEARMKPLEEQYNALEEELIKLLDEQNSTKGDGTKATVSLRVADVFNIEDRAALDKFIKRTGHFQLLQNRVSNPAVEELLSTSGKKEIPGLKKFTKKSINLRSK